jgi:hypothetical protein
MQKLPLIIAEVFCCRPTLPKAHTFNLKNCVWHQDNEDLFAVMEKMRLQIFHGTEPEVFFQILFFLQSLVTVIFNMNLPCSLVATT